MKALSLCGSFVAETTIACATILLEKRREREREREQ